MNEQKTKIASLVKTGMTQRHLSGLSEMLRDITIGMEAHGCILWQVTPNADLKKDPPEGQLFVLAHWFPGNRVFALHDLPLSSLTGTSVLRGCPLKSDHVETDQRIHPDPFLKRAGILTMLAVPVEFANSIKGAVNLYRTEQRVFTEEEILEAVELASFVPSLYHAIRDRVSLSLIKSVNKVLQENELTAGGESSRQPEKALLQKLCNLIAETFQSVETSIFLQDDAAAQERYNVMATTWRGRFRKSEYKRSYTEGLTGWVLENAKPVKIFDLEAFDEEEQSIRKEYPQIVWKDSLDFRNTVRHVLELGPEEESPPLSFMAAPILLGKKVLGAIRCCTSKRGPYYYAERELNLLELIAAQLGQYWNNRQVHREMREENESWRNLVRSVRELNRFVHKELTKEAPNEILIFEEALKLTSAVITGAEIMDVRLVTEDKKDLVFGATFGEAWREGTDEAISTRRQIRFPLTGQPQSAGAWVLHTGKCRVMEDVQSDPYYKNVFPDVMRMIVAPIGVENERYGVLDIRSTDERSFQRHAKEIAELVGQQLGMYHFLATTIRQLHEATSSLNQNVANLQLLQSQQAQTFADLEHQLKSPIIQAYARVELVLKESSLTERARSNLKAIKSLCAKAKRVALSTGLFAKLAREEAIRPTKRLLQAEQLVHMLRLAAGDNEIIVAPDRKISFHVRERSLDVVKGLRVEVDMDLLEQAINNLLDNAGKYSFRNNKVDISAGLTGSDRFFISIRNKGLAIKQREVLIAAKRGWRGGKAEASTGEGSGIGLWIVDNIMKAHNGELQIVPTNDAGFTDVRLIFPCSRI